MATRHTKKVDPYSTLIEFEPPKPRKQFGYRTYTGYGYTTSKKIAKNGAIGLRKINYLARVTYDKVLKDYVLWIASKR